MSERKTTEQFIKEAVSKHGFFYDYKDVKYINGMTKVHIHCPKHGSFLQAPKYHLKGIGCGECAKISRGKKRRLTKEKFIQKAQSVHGLLYDYSDVEYVNSSTSVLIHCKEHGGFWQQPDGHLQGHGCNKCGRTSQTNIRRLTTEKFIEKAKSIHGSFYDYSGTEYVNCKTKIFLNCPTHGRFHQSPSDHLSGCGCPECGKVSAGDSRRTTTEQFIQKAQSVHGTLFGYENVKYINSKKSVIIRCKIHGNFLQMPYNHLMGKGCLDCANAVMGDNRKLTKEQFTEKAQSVHGDFYNYEDVEYINTKTPVSINCPIHGVFWQMPINHLKGRGCSCCASYGFDQQKPSILYFVKLETPLAVFWKIGITNRTVKDRFGKEDYDCIKEQTTWELPSGYEAHKIERSVLSEFSEYKIDRFLFNLLKLGGETECFANKLPKAKVIQFINAQIKKLENDRPTIINADLLLSTRNS